MIATPAEQQPAESGHSRNSGFGLRSSDFRAALPSTGRTVEQPCLRGALLGLEIGTSQGTLPVGAGRFGRAPHIALSGAFLALRAPDCNGWPRDGLRDSGAIGTQEEPAVFRRNTRALRVLRDSGPVKRKGRSLPHHSRRYTTRRASALRDLQFTIRWKRRPNPNPA